MKLCLMMSGVLLKPFNPPLVGMVVETIFNINFAIVIFKPFNPLLVGMVVETPAFRTCTKSNVGPFNPPLVGMVVETSPDASGLKFGTNFQPTSSWDGR